ncbi:MAG: hypothetical protein J3R72DRAFT_258961 [Linnemannia gamsii]|nr:MAG: hypothetical protein J3R72DRAFT_258961 [Linnemannia gamsii]
MLNLIARNSKSNTSTLESQSEDERRVRGAKTKQKKTIATKERKRVDSLFRIDNCFDLITSVRRLLTPENKQNTAHNLNSLLGDPISLQLRLPAAFLLLAFHLDHHLDLHLQLLLLDVCIQRMQPIDQVLIFIFIFSQPFFYFQKQQSPRDFFFFFYFLFSPSPSLLLFCRRRPRD